MYLKTLALITYYFLYLSYRQQIIPIEETEDIVETEDDFYDVTKTAKFDSAGVQSPIKITCKIHIPHTTYTGISIMSRKRIGKTI